jgi:hypothetical protein
VLSLLAADKKMKCGSYNELERIKNKIPVLINTGLDVKVLKIKYVSQIK